MENEHRWLLLERALKEAQLCEIARRLYIEGIAAINIKGWAVGRFYPENVIRRSTDFDFIVNPVESKYVESFVRTSSGLSNYQIDLHFGLRHLDRIDWNTAFSRSQLADLNGTPIRVLADEDNLRVTATHWLIDGGVYEDRLNDIYFLVKNRKDEFDWDLCLESAGPVRKGWVIAAIAAARDYKGLDVSDLPETIRAYELPDWFSDTLEKEWSRGPYLRMPIWNCLGKPKLLVEQIRRRFPPNKIAATVDVEGNIESGGRLPYQLKSLSKKIKPAIMGLYSRYIANSPTSNDQRHV